MEYLLKFDVHLMLMDTFKNGSFTPEDEWSLWFYNIDTSSSSSVPERVGDSIQFGIGEFAKTFIIKEFGTGLYVYVLIVDLKSQEPNEVYESKGKVACYEIGRNYQGELFLAKRAEYETDKGAFTTIDLFQNRYLICCNKSVNLFDTRNPDSISLIKNDVLLNDFVMSSEVIQDKYLVLSHYTCISFVLGIYYNKEAGEIDFFKIAKDYDWQYPGIFKEIEPRDLPCLKFNQYDKTWSWRWRK